MPSHRRRSSASGSPFRPTGSISSGRCAIRMGDLREPPAPDAERLLGSEKDGLPRSLAGYAAPRSPRYSRRCRVLLAALLLCTFGYAAWAAWGVRGSVHERMEAARLRLHPSSLHLPPPTREPLPHVYRGDTTTLLPLNETLGFQAIFALNMPTRPDKRDELHLLAHAAGLKIDIRDGVDGKTIKHQSAPDMIGHLGALRGHANVLREIVERRLTSALVIEDDADWDVDFRVALQRLMGPLATLKQSMHPDATIAAPSAWAPWGEMDYDVLWLGHTHEASWNEPNGPRPYVSYEDDTLADYEKTEVQNRWVFNDYRIALPKQEHAGELAPPRRVVQKGRHPMGSQAYVLTFKGALKMLYHVNHVPFRPFDEHLKYMLETDVLDSYCVVPALFSMYLSPQGVTDSDVSIAQGVDKPRQLTGSEGYAWDIRKSSRASLEARLNATVPPQ